MHKKALDCIELFCSCEALEQLWLFCSQTDSLVAIISSGETTLRMSNVSNCHCACSASLPLPRCSQSFSYALPLSLSLFIPLSLHNTRTANFNTLAEKRAGKLQKTERKLHKTLLLKSAKRNAMLEWAGRGSGSGRAGVGGGEWGLQAK